MKLGNASQITIGVHDINASYAFYQKLGFKKVGGSLKPNPWVQITDGTLLLLLNQDGMKYMSLTYFSLDAQNRLDELEKLNVNFLVNKPNQGIFVSPDNMGVSLVCHNSEKLFQPKGRTLKDIPKADMQNNDVFPNKKIGVFGELAHPVSDLEASISFWNQLGFSTLSINKKPYPWAVVYDDFNLLGLHQTKHFTWPAITYYSPDMDQKIAKLQQDGISSIKGFGKTNGTIRNGVVDSPEGQKLFLFSL